MFGLGFLEIALIAVVVVVLFPPTEIPKLARSLARGYGSIRRVADEFRATVLEDDDIGKPIQEIRTAYQETRYQLRKAEEAARRDLARTRSDVRDLVDTAKKQVKPASPPPGGTVANTDHKATEAEGSAKDQRSSPSTPTPVRDSVDTSSPTLAAAPSPTSVASRDGGTESESASETTKAANTGTGAA